MVSVQYTEVKLLDIEDFTNFALLLLINPKSKTFHG